MGRGFQYRKRYEVTCDPGNCLYIYWNSVFQYRKRYEVTCDNPWKEEPVGYASGFNTASGMRSHATLKWY